MNDDIVYAKYDCSTDDFDSWLACNPGCSSMELVGILDSRAVFELGEKVMQSTVRNLRFSMDLRFFNDGEEVIGISDLASGEVYWDHWDVLIKDCCGEGPLPPFLKMLVNLGYSRDYVIGSGLIMSLDGRVVVHISDSPTVVIPRGVVVVGNCAFKGFKIKNVCLLDGVRELGIQCFEDCESLKNIELPNSVVKLGDTCFCGCYGLRDVVMSSQVTVIPSGCFMYCDGLEKVPVTGNVRRIEDCAFHGTLFRYVKIPEGVEYIGDMAFCSDLEQFYIPSTVKEINPTFYCEEGIAGEEDLPKIYVDLKNPRYYDIRGVLYDKVSGERVIKYSR